MCVLFGFCVYATVRAFNKMFNQHQVGVTEIVMAVAWSLFYYFNMGGQL